MNHLNPWENSIRQGLEHHEAVPPVMGWKKLEQSLRALEAAGTASDCENSVNASETAEGQKAGTHFTPTWVKGALATIGMAAAASVAVVILLHGPHAVDTVPTVQQANHGRSATEGPKQQTLARSSEEPMEPRTAEQTNTSSSSSVTASPKTTMAIAARAITQEEDSPALASLSLKEGEALPCASGEDEAALQEEGLSEEKSKEHREVHAPTSADRSYAPQLLSMQHKAVDRTIETLATTARRGLRPHFALHMNTSGARRMSQRGTYYNAPRLPLAGNVTVMGVPHEDFVYIVDANMDKSVQSSVHHKRPFQTGLSVSLPITHRWSVRTGLAYTCLSTDIQAGSDVAYYVTEQNLHYVGIPLSAAYSIYASRYFDCYASAGTMLEKCVKAKRSTSYNNMEQQRTSDARTSGFADGLWQASVNVSVGAQLNLIPQLGLYFEPGVSYFIPDGSSLPNIRHEHPWNFSMQGGLRWNLGK